MGFRREIEHYSRDLPPSLFGRNRRVSYGSIGIPLDGLARDFGIFRPLPLAFHFRFPLGYLPAQENDLLVGSRELLQRFEIFFHKKSASYSIREKRLFLSSGIHSARLSSGFPSLFP